MTDDTQFQAGLVYATRGGDRVRVTEITQGECWGYNLKGVILTQEDKWTLDGRYLSDGTDDFDLLPTPIADDDDKAELLAALRPFSEMAGELFARNWNRDDVAMSMKAPDGRIVTLTFADFLAARAAIAKAEQTS